MSLVSTLSREDYIALQDKISEQVVGAISLEDAAQKYMSILYETSRESIVLARLFATIPFAALPEPNKAFVMSLAQSTGIAQQIGDATLVLSLLGTRGDKPEWNDRRRSLGHVGIPLASSAFIGRVPMISRLLKELGTGIDWIDSNDTKLVAKTFESLSGVFHVLDARTEVDSQGRKVIAAQDFVEAEGIRTVFGVGGCYIGTSLFFAAIVFLREFLEKNVAERFTLQANKFKTATMDLVDEGRIFS